MDLSLLIFVFLCFSSDSHSCHRCPSLSSLSLLYFLLVTPLSFLSSLSHASCFALTPSLYSYLSLVHPFWLSHLPFLCHSCSVLDVIMVCCGRALDSPCTLALLVGFQFAFVLYFSLGGFRGLVSVLVHSTEPEIDYSRPHDVYTNLTSLLLHHPGPSGPEQQLRDCTLPSPLLGRYKSTLKWLRHWSIIGCVHSLSLIAVFSVLNTLWWVQLTQKIRFYHHLFTLYLSKLVTFFLLWITKKGILKNVLNILNFMSSGIKVLDDASYFHFMEIPFYSCVWKKIKLLQQYNIRWQIFILRC